MLRLLVVTYYFPPAAGAGVQRVLKWVKYLREFDVEPVVLTVEAGAYPGLDSSLVHDVPGETVVHRTRALDPFGLYARLQGRSRQEVVTETTGRISQNGTWSARAARWVRANVFVPDARLGWVPFAVSRGRRLLQSERFDAILTSGPPHSTHLIGWALNRRMGVPWIADFRDPWTDIHYNYKLPRHPLARALDATLERAVLSKASVVTTVSPSLRTLLAAKTDRTHEDIRVIYNGYDADDFAAEPPSQASDRFVLSYVGTLFEQPTALWRVLSRFVAQGLAEHLYVRLVGSVPSDIAAVLQGYGIAERVEILPYVAHDAAVDEMRAATALLLTVESWPHSEIVMPGKMYEYLAAGRTVIGLGPEAGDAALVLRAASAGRMFDRDDTDGLFEHLLGMYRRWEAGDAIRGADARATLPFTRRAQAEQVARVVRTAVELS